jgi:hypothetical protein
MILNNILMRRLAIYENANWRKIKQWLRTRIGMTINEHIKSSI